MTRAKAIGFLVVAGVVVGVIAAYHFLWPRYSWQRYIDPENVFLAVIPEVPETYEVHRHRDPALLKRLVRALNGGRDHPAIRLGLGGVLVLHRRGGPSILIRYGGAPLGGAILFREPPRASRRGSMDLYRSHALAKTLKAIRSSKHCVARRPSIPRRSLARLEVYTAGTRRDLSGADPRANAVVRALNPLLQSVHTSFYALLGDPTEASFYAGQADPRTHIAPSTGALLTLSTPLSMHTTMMFWGRESGPPAEYQELKTNMILVSDALSVKGQKVVGLSSDAKPNRFYLFEPRGPCSEADRIAEKWDAIMRAIRDAVAPPSQMP